MIATILKLLGIDPLSMLGKIFSVFIPFLPILAICGMIYGAYLYGVSHGNVVCDNSKLAATITIKDAQIKDLKQQYKDLIIIVQNLETKNHKLDQDLDDALGKLDTIVLGGESCDQSKELVDTLNKLRTP